MPTVVKIAILAQIIRKYCSNVSNFSLAGKLLDKSTLREAKRLGYSDRQIAVALGSDAAAIKALKDLKVGLGYDENGSVTEVSFFNTEATDDDLVHLKGLPKLTTLFIGSRIGDKGLSHVEGLTTLNFIDCTFNTKITDKGVAYLEGLINLEGISLADTQVTDKGLKYLRNLKSLKGISLPDTRITNAGLAHLKDLTNLESLGLSSTKVTDDGLAHISRLTNLTGLTLAMTDITDDGLQHLSTLKKLQGLNLAKTGVTAEGVVKLNKAIPRCRIFFQ